MSERRQEPRLRSLLSGQILLGERASTMDCTIRNISQRGAMVLSSESFRLPGDVDLRIPHRDEMFSARVVWRRHDSAGLALSPIADIAPTRQKLTRAQKDRAALKAARAAACF